MRYDKLGIARPSNAVAYALQRYHGFDQRDMDQLRRHPGVLPYDTFSALRNIRRERIGKPRRFEVSRLLGLVTNSKTSKQHYSSAHLPPRSTHRYDHRRAWTKDDKRTATRAQPRIDRTSPVYALVRNDIQRGGGNNTNNNNNRRPPTRPSSRPPLPLPPPPPGLTPEEVERFYRYFHMYSGGR